MTLEEYCGEECAQSIRKILKYARQVEIDDREILANQLHKEADKQPKDSVHIMLIKIAVPDLVGHKKT